MYPVDSLQGLSWPSVGLVSTSSRDPQCPTPAPVAGAVAEADDKPKGYKMPEIVIVQEPHSGRRTRGM